MTIKPTTPPSSPLDTLKALALRNIDELDYVIDQLGGSVDPVPEHVIEFLEHVQQSQYAALNEHMPVGKHEHLDELRKLPEEAFRYDDGSPVKMSFNHPHLTSSFFPRYSDEHTVRESHLASVAEITRRINDEQAFDNIVRDVDWGRNGPVEG